MRPCIVAACLIPLACHGTDGVAVPVTSHAGLPLRWLDREIMLRASPEAAGTAIEPRLTFALERAAATWNAALRRCDAPRIVLGERLSRAAIREDLVNEVLFHRREWCPPSAADFEDCYDRSLNASTRLRQRNARDSQIQEADIEINGAAFRWSLDGKESGTLSLEAALVHELGHVLGLDHPCSGGGPGARRGLVPCSDAGARRAVMHPDAAEILIGQKPEPLGAEVEMVCRNHALRQ
jgi:hypothetical protein